MVHRLAGVSFPIVKATIFEKNKKIASKTGKLLFTYFGLSGPLILNMSRTIGEALKKGEVSVSLDFHPQKSAVEFNAEVLKIFSSNQNKKIKNVASLFLPPKIADVALSVLGIDPEKFVNLVSRDERLRLVKFAKDMRLTVSGALWGSTEPWSVPAALNRARSILGRCAPRSIPIFTFLGDALNFNRPSGGFSLQICWTTGYFAGESVLIEK